MCKEEMTHRDVVKFLPVVCLERKNWESELCVYVGEERADDGRNVRFLSNRESPNVMGVSIKQNNIIFETRMTVNW